MPQVPDIVAAARAIWCARDAPDAGRSHPAQGRHGHGDRQDRRVECRRRRRRQARATSLFEIETDKAAMEIEAPADGTIRDIAGKEGVDIPVGSPVAWIYAAGEKYEGRRPMRPRQSPPLWGRCLRRPTEAGAVPAADAQPRLCPPLACRAISPTRGEISLGEIRATPLSSQTCAREQYFPVTDRRLWPAWSRGEDGCRGCHQGTPLWPAGHLPLKGGDHFVTNALANHRRCGGRQAAKL